MIKPLYFITFLLARLVCMDSLLRCIGVKLETSVNNKILLRGIYTYDFIARHEKCIIKGLSSIIEEKPIMDGLFSLDNKLHVSQFNRIHPGQIPEGKWEFFGKQNIGEVESLFRDNEENENDIITRVYKTHCDGDSNLVTNAEAFLNNVLLTNYRNYCVRWNQCEECEQPEINLIKTEPLASKLEIGTKFFRFKNYEDKQNCLDCNVCNKKARCKECKECRKCRDNSCELIHVFELTGDGKIKKYNIDILSMKDESLI